jgi:hypothetical protein
VLVHIPFQLHDPKGFDHIKAGFGFPTVSAAKSLAAYVYYIEQTLCAPVTNQTIGYPDHETWHTPFILLINGGGICSPVMRVRHAQMIGASAVLLSAPHCSCGNNTCTNTYPEDTCVNTDPVLVDDGSGADVTIPSVMIERVIGEKLKNELRNGHPCMVEVQWGIPEDNVTSIVPQVRYWSHAYDPTTSLASYVDMRTVVESFAGSVSFEPRFALFAGSRFGCPDNPGKDGRCNGLCTNEGMYCTVHALDLSGNAIIKETLRRLCVWQHYAATYWDYVIDHKQACGSDPHKFADPNCIEGSLKVGKMDVNTINGCIANSGGVDNGTNTLLDSAVQYTESTGVVSLPAITVNHKPLTWTSARSLFDTVCTDYWLSGIDKIPPVCERCLACPDSVGCLKAGHCVDFNNRERFPDTGLPAHKDQKERKKKGGGGWRVFWWLVAILALGGGAFYVYQNYYVNQGDSSYRRSGLISDYMHLSSED